MTAIQVSIRDQLETRINAVKAGSLVLTELPSGLTLTTFTVAASYFPQENLEDLTDPKVKLVATGFQSSRDRLLRNKSLEIEVPVQVAIQQKVDPTDTATIDQLVELVEQLQLVCEHDFTNPHYSWLSTDPLRDENGLVYSYQQLFTLGIFQAIFTVRYKHLLQRYD